MTSTQQINGNSVNSVVIAGGGTAGWLCAAIIAARKNPSGELTVPVTLVESPDVKILGVGEGTWPTMRDTLRRIGVDETEFLLDCDASFKQGTCFKNWRNNQTDDIYYHPFELPLGFLETDIDAWWHLSSHSQSYADLFTTQVELCKQFKAPKQAQTPSYAAVANYGYHLDANKFAEFLKKHCVNKLNVKHVVEHIENVERDNNGYITALSGKDHRIEGDLFIDCTGFSATLIGKHLGSEFTSADQSLLNNQAIAVQARYKSELEPIASCTLSTAQKHGWIWDIGLPSRKGIGYVHSADHCDFQQAADTLEHYLKMDKSVESVDSSQFREIRFRPSYRKNSWVKNCVAIGTSAGFLEPLEASALVMTELAAHQVAEQAFVDFRAMEATAQAYNSSFEIKWKRIIDFLKLHYALSERNDSDYWRNMRNEGSFSPQLKDWLLQWQQRGVSQYDFVFSNEIFPMASYQYILNGMGFHPQRKSRVDDVQDSSISRLLQRNMQRKKQHITGLPSNREYLNGLFSSVAKSTY